MLLKEDISYCRGINKKYGKSYFFATQFFPKDLREATYILYAFFRLPDEIVDNPINNREKELSDFINKWEEAIKYGDSDNKVLRATIEIHKKYEIPFDYSMSFLSAMKQDLTKNRYDNFTDLNQYIYGSASCVGFMMSYLIGFDKDKKDEVLKYAEDLGIAMQLTNFLRDIKEDFEKRNRIYIPKDELNKFSVQEKNIRDQIVDDNFIELMKYQIDKCRIHYKKAEKNGIPLLSKRGQVAVLIASKLYSEILREIEKQNYDIFKKRAKVSFIKKLIILWRTIIKKS